MGRGAKADGIGGGITSDVLPKSTTEIANPGIRDDPDDRGTNPGPAAEPIPSDRLFPHTPIGTPPGMADDPESDPH